MSDFQEGNQGVEESIFDQPFQMQVEDDDLVIDHSNYESPVEYTDDDFQDVEMPFDDEQGNQEGEDKPTINPKIEGNEQDDLDFEDELTKLVQQRDEEPEDNEEELINKLKAMGYDVSKNEANTPQAQEKVDLERLDGLITRGNDFLQLSDEDVVKRKIRLDISEKYAKSGRQHLIGTEDFEAELEVEYDEYDASPKLLQMYADNIRRDVQESIQQHYEDKNKILQGIEERETKKLAENRVKLQGVFRTMAGSKQGFLGIKMSADDTKEIYNSVISGQFTKRVNEDPQLVAEFATYLKFREQIFSKVGGPSYGEGVKAAVDAMTGNKNGRPSPLGTAINSASSQGGNGNNPNKAWAMKTVKVQPSSDDKGKYVAGTGLY